MIANVQSIAATGVNSASALTAVFGASVTAGNLIVVCCSLFNSGITVTVTDSLGNTYTQVDTYSVNGSYRASMFYAKNITGGACTVSVTPSATAYRSMVAIEYSGADPTSPLDASSKSTSSTALMTTGNITVSQNSELVVAVFSSFLVTNSISNTNGRVIWSNSSNTVPSPTVTEQFSSATVNATATIIPVVSSASIGASFKAVSPPSSGGGVSRGRLL